jgi:hypothetical protein
MPAVPGSGAATAQESDVSGMVLHGQVRDTAGTPLRTRVLLTAENGTVHMARSDEYGLYALDGIEPGTYTSRVEVSLYQDSEQPLALPSGKPLVRHDIVLTPSLVLPVRLLLPDGRPIQELDAAELGIDPKLAGLAVLATTEPITSIPLSNRTHVLFGIGRFHPRLRKQDGSVEDPPPGALGFLEVRGGYPFIATAVLRQTKLASVLVPRPVEEVRLTVTPESVRENLSRVTVRLVDAESGEPLTEGRVVLGDYQSPKQTESPDDEGVVRFEAVSPGLLILAPQFEGYELNRDYFRVEPAEDVDLGTLALARQTTVSGRVSVERGRTMSVQFRARSLDRMTFPQPLNTGIGGSVRTKDGRFTLEGLGRGKHLLMFRSPDVARAAIEIDTSGGDIDDLEVHLPAGTEVTLQMNGNVMQSLLWQVLDPAGRLLISELFLDQAALQARLIPGLYRVRIYEDETLLKEIPFEVGAEPRLFEFTP